MKDTYRNIVGLMDPPPYHWVGDGFRVHNFFPALPAIGLDGMSPFFLMDYGARYYFPPASKPRGVGVHPHRGIETVTISYQGRVAHHDSSGNSGVIGEGDVQWMTAGVGVLHKEYHEEEFSRKGGHFQMVQLWVNLPAKYKMTPAKYQAIENGRMGKYLSGDKKSSADIIAGEFKGVKGPAFTFSPVNLFNFRMLKEAEEILSFPESYNAGILVPEGGIIVNDSTEVSENQFVYFGHRGKDIKVKAQSNCIILVMSGEPLNEPIAPHGPFVMNTKEEIQQAYEDYYNGKFGHLED